MSRMHGICNFEKMLEWEKSEYKTIKAINDAMWKLMMQWLANYYGGCKEFNVR